MQKNIWQMLKWLKDKTTKKDKNNLSSSDNNNDDKLENNDNIADSQNETVCENKQEKEKAEEYMKLSLDALGTYAEEEYLKKQFDEIKEMINVLSKPS